jgi:hypothetical protein
MDSERNPADDHLPANTTGRNITGIFRAVRRRSLTGGSLAVVVLFEWFPAIHGIQSAVHYTGLGLATIITVDLCGGFLAKAYRALRGKVVILDFTDH